MVFEVGATQIHMQRDLHDENEPRSFRILPILCLFGCLIYDKVIIVKGHTLNTYRK